MLGKGLESLIPPQRNSDEFGVGPAPQDGEGGLPAAGGGTSWEPAAAPLPHGGASEPQRGESKKKEGRAAADYVFHIEVAKIKPNPHQPRRSFDEEGIKELAASVREFGFLQPLVVTKRDRETPDGVDVEYELIAGERRLLAAKMLGLELVPAIIRSVDLERERLEMAVIENLQREDLNPLEAARAFAKLQEEFRLTQREIAVRLGKSRESVANTLRLLALPTYLQEAVAAGRISESHGRLLLQISDPAAQRALFDELLRERMTTRAFRARVDSAKPKPKKERQEILSPELRALEEKLSMELGTPVSISRLGESGKITITFYSEEELRGILSKFGGDQMSL